MNTMRGIDISNWQGGLNLVDLVTDIDFVICKSTEGLNFVDDFCEAWFEQANMLGLLFGFYHYAKNNDPIKEADFFISKSKAYFGHGLPVLDIETSIYNWTDYAEKFCKRVYDKTKIWPLVYTSAGFLSNLEEFRYTSKCGLWVAGYPYQASTWTDEYCPYNVNPWSKPVIWQFTDVLKLDGYAGDLDANIAYVSRETWVKMSSPNGAPKPKPTRKKDKSVVAYEIILGKWGNGLKRKKELENAGYDYTEMQKYVNSLYSKAHKVLHGEYGNNYERKKKLGKDYDAVQYIVNDILS